jgi:hypothetical protein
MGGSHPAIMLGVPLMTRPVNCSAGCTRKHKPRVGGRKGLGVGCHGCVGRRTEDEWADGRKAQLISSNGASTWRRPQAAGRLPAHRSDHPGRPDERLLPGRRPERPTRAALPDRPYAPSTCS